MHEERATSRMRLLGVMAVLSLAWMTGCSSNSVGSDKVDASVAAMEIDAAIELCQKDEHVIGNACVACPPGLLNEASDDSTGPDTNCDDVCTPVLGIDCNEFEEGYIKASNTDADDEFGHSVALSGDTLAIGTYREGSNATGVDGDQSDNSAPNSGAVYIFTRSGGVWSQQAYLKASNAEAGDQFGRSLALSGNTLAVGAPVEESGGTGIGGDQSDNSAPGSGAVYVFTRTSEVWSQQAYLKASNAEQSDLFGGTVALSDDTLVVSATNEASNALGVNGDQTDNSLRQSGAVYVFTRSSDAWNQQAYLKASNAGEGDIFSVGLALSGDTLAVGATGEKSSATGVNGNQTNDSLPLAGAVYVFVRTGGVWSQQAYVKASNTSQDDEFGENLALADDTLVVGTFFEDSSANGVDGNQADDSAQASGAAYVFTRTNGVWSQQAYLKASNTNTDDNFGSAVALTGDTLAIGACSEDSAATGVDGDQADNSAVNSGGVYIFTRSGDVWSQQAFVKASNTAALDQFCGPLALSGDALAVGALGEDSAATGIDGDQSDNMASSSGAVYVRRLGPMP